MNTAPRKVSLTELADQALARKTTGETHADLAVQAEGMSDHKKAALEEMAQIDETYATTLQWIGEAREATFTDPFARASYFRGTIAKLSEEECLDPNKVLATFFSARGKTMHVRGQKSPQPAIPLFTIFKDRADAVKQFPSPVITPDSNRNRERGEDHMNSRGHVYLVPTTSGDRACFEQMSKLLRRMPEVFLKWLETNPEEDLRQLAWLALHFFPGSYVLRPEDIERMFNQRRGVYVTKDGRATYLFFRLSQSEFLMVVKTADTEKLVTALQARRAR